MNNLRALNCTSEALASSDDDHMLIKSEPHTRLVWYGASGGRKVAVVWVVAAAEVALCGGWMHAPMSLPCMCLQPAGRLPNGGGSPRGQAGAIQWVYTHIWQWVQIRVTKGLE